MAEYGLALNKMLHSFVDYRCHVLIIRFVIIKVKDLECKYKASLSLDYFKVMHIESRSTSIALNITIYDRRGLLPVIR